MATFVRRRNASRRDGQTTRTSRSARRRATRAEAIEPGRPSQRIRDHRQDDQPPRERALRISTEHDHPRSRRARHRPRRTRPAALRAARPRSGADDRPAGVRASSDPRRRRRATRGRRPDHRPHAAASRPSRGADRSSRSDRPASRRACTQACLTAGSAGWPLGNRLSASSYASATGLMASRSVSSTCDTGSSRCPGASSPQRYSHSRAGERPAQGGEIRNHERRFRVRAPTVANWTDGFVICSGRSFVHAQTGISACARTFCPNRKQVSRLLVIDE